MFRLALGVGSIAILVLSATGCQMCCHPYDRSGPVFCDGCSSSACSRAGSIFAGCPEPSVSLAKDSTHRGPASESPTPAQAKRQRPPTTSYVASGKKADSTLLTPVQSRKQRPPISYVMAGNRADSPLPTLAEAKQPQTPASFPTAGDRPEGPLLGPAKPGDVPGSERIVSVTEKVVGPSAESSEAATEPSPAPSRSMPATGWTARRTTNELLR
jgi:hypothetical protein